jgi:hypothetical protein
MDDGRGRLRGAGTGELALGRERDPADPRPAIAGGLADEDDPRVGVRFEIRAEPLAPQR